MCLLHFLNFLLCHVLESSVIPVARVINNSTANNVYEWGLFGLNFKKKSNWGSIQYNSILLLLKNWKRKTSCNLVSVYIIYVLVSVTHQWDADFLLLLLLFCPHGLLTNYQQALKPFFQKKKIVPNIWPQAHYVEYWTSFFLPTD